MTPPRATPSIQGEGFWNKLAERYSQQPIANLEAYHAKLETTKALLSPADRVLDIGCGTGSLALELAPHVDEVHAVDISREMIRIAERKTAEKGVTNITYHHTIADSLPFENASFDVICAYNILHLVDDSRATLRRLFDLLKPEGLLISTTPCLRESYVPYGLILPLLRLVGKAPPVKVIDIKTLEQHMRDAGFVDLEKPQIPASKMTAFVHATKPKTA